MQKTMVTRLTTRKIAGVEVDGKELAFGERTNSFEVTDPGLAAEINDRYGPKATGDVVVAPHSVSDPGHRYTFTVPEMPWKRKKQDELSS
jgi:hypothetical protein